jgi:Zn-dependent protease
MQELTVVQRIVIWALPVLFAITVHEVAHGWVAMKLGDPTAKMLGRLTLNPLKHIDPIGTVLLPLLMMWAGGIVFGWAKPVPITWENLKNPRRDIALVALAGPLSNLLMVLFWAGLMKIGYGILQESTWLGFPLLYMGTAGIFINIIMAVLNLLPLPPLDGGRVLSGILPGPWAYQLSRLEPYGFFILIGLMATGILGKILWPPIKLIQTLVYGVFGL